MPSGAFNFLHKNASPDSFFVWSTCEEENIQLKNFCSLQENSLIASFSPNSSGDPSWKRVECLAWKWSLFLLPHQAWGEGTFELIPKFSFIRMNELTTRVKKNFWLTCTLHQLTAKRQIFIEITNCKQNTKGITSFVYRWKFDFLNQV